ncbi:MAG: GNAT family N-acetyltransferase [Clostridium fessum]
MARMQPVPDVPGTFHACFYGFRVHDLCRGLGIGEAAFCLVLNDLIARGCTRIVLHVSSDNYPALSIYAKSRVPNYRNPVLFYVLKIWQALQPPKAP